MQVDNEAKRLRSKSSAGELSKKNEVEFMPKGMRPFKPSKTIARVKLQDEVIRESILAREVFSSTYDVFPELSSVILKREKELERIKFKGMDFRLHYFSISLMILAEMKKNRKKHSVGSKTGSLKGVTGMTGNSANSQILGY